jgi:chemosensory pili system protein ChpA (sensor histidine kinase/response regulator)
VRSRVASLRGVVALDSTPGGGTRFTLRLPLTLAITRALLVRVSGRILALPAAVVERVSRIDRAEIHREAEHAWITLEGEDLPVRALADVLTLRGKEEAAAARPLALVVDLGDHREVFLVDALIESREVVVKPLGPMLRRVAGLTGATLLGDGSVVPILDPYTLPEGKLAPPSFFQDRPAVTTLIPWRLEVMIVDDSLSVRRVLSNLAVNAGWLPSTARDGLEALELLQRRSHPPDVLLLDVEMPRMDGYELAATLRAQAAYASLPIVMITSRAGAKHREKAFASGVSQYLVKPFDPEVLINLVERLTAVGPVQRHSALLPPSPPAAGLQ